MLNKLKMIILKRVLNKEERRFISSALYTSEECYKDRYNDFTHESFKSEILKNNVPKLINIRKMFDDLI